MGIARASREEAWPCGKTELQEFKIGDFPQALLLSRESPQGQSDILCQTGFGDKGVGIDHFRYDVALWREL